MASIEWVYDYGVGPNSGVLRYEDRQFWFKKNSEDGYDLFIVDDNLLKELLEDHLEFCECTGYPKMHGDPHTVPRKNMINRMVFPEEGVEVKPRPMLGIQVYTRKINSSTIPKEFYKTIEMSEIINYDCPRDIQI